jgi:UrcA family protein
LEELIMNTTIGNKLLAAIACIVGTAALGGLSSGALASDQNPPSKVIHFSDLDISKPAGAAALLRRIRVAAQDVCQQSTGGDPILQMAGGHCIQKAIDDAVRKIDAPALTALRFGTSDMRLASK